ncbi:MAG: hypothetical protein NTY38_23470 [Acidobacteria bacterium]|nr:hypothetical protein [Acidobacteriota bacterium]
MSHRRHQFVQDSNRRRRGQATIEYVIVYGAVIAPLTFALIFTAQILWIWHSVVEFTRDGAQYAATHCWQSSADNVRAYMTSHVPLMMDIERFRGGDAQVNIDYFAREADTGAIVPFSCAGSDCSADCVPDLVTVSIAGYEYRSGFLSYMGVASIPIPDFRTTLPVESAGCAADASGLVACTP